MTSKKKTIGIVLSLIITSVCFYYLADSFICQWEEIRVLINNIRYSYVALFFLVFSLEYVMESWFVVKILSYQGITRPLSTVTGIFYLSGLAKYFPIKGVDIIGRFYLFLKIRVSKSDCMAYIIFEAMYSITGTMLVICLMLLNLKSGSLMLAFIGFALLFLASAVLLPFSSQVLNKIIPSKLKKNNLVLIKFNFQQSFNLLFITTVSKAVIGIAFFLMINSIYSLPLKYLFHIIGIQGISWILTLTAFFVPKGLGVREVSTVFLLSQYVPKSIALSASLIYRITTIILDGLFACYGVWENKKRM